MSWGERSRYLCILLVLLLSSSSFAFSCLRRRRLCQMNGGWQIRNRPTHFLLGKRNCPCLVEAASTKQATKAVLFIFWSPATSAAAHFEENELQRMSGVCKFVSGSNCRVGKLNGAINGNCLQVEFYVLATLWKWPFSRGRMHGWLEKEGVCWGADWGRCSLTQTRPRTLTMRPKSIEAEEEEAENDEAFSAWPKAPSATPLSAQNA